MEKFRWEIKYEIGIDIIDKQHKELFQKIDILLKAVYGNQAKNEIKEIDDSLLSFITCIPVNT